MFKQIFETYKKSFTGLSRETWLLSTVILINRCGFMAVPFMSLYVTQYLHHSASDAGLIITLFGVGSIAGASTGGYLTDKIGYRPVQILSAMIGGSLFLVFAAITHFSTLCLLSLVISFFTEAFRPANFTATAAYAKEGTQTRSYSLNRFAMNIGWAVGTSLGGILASIDYRLLFVVDGSINIIAALCILWWLPSSKAHVKKMKEKLATTIVRRPWQDAIFIRFILVTTLFATCFFLMFRVAPLFFKEVWHMNESLIGLILALNGIIIALFEMVMISKIEKRRAPLQFAIIGSAFLGISFLFLILPSSVSILASVLSMILFTVGEMFALPFINTFVISRTDELNRGKYAASYTVCWSFAQVVGPAGGFYLAEKTSYALLWVLLFVFLIVCGFGYHFLHHRAKAEKTLLATY
jgi:predicted MFS family arabinose efflux permease